ncbi:MAG TPA: DNA polymerase Y family protein [Terriglobales bacterium]|nr:DNA polymerase Y family protein [Terriglobales bacterium]
MRSASMRIACLYLPGFPLAALLRMRPELRREAVAVIDGDGPRAKVLAVAPAAESAGIRPGHTSAQARAIAAQVQLEVLAAEALRGAQAALCDVAESFSPRIEDAGDGVVYFDLSGLHSLYPNEAGLADAIAERARYLGVPAQVGIAGSKIAAYLAARDGNGCAAIPPGEEWSFLAPMPVGLLEPSPALVETLRRWGIKTVGELAALPARAIGTRLGPEGVALVARARGEDAQPLVPRTLPLQFEESVELDYGLDAIEPFLFVLRPLLERLTARLAVRGLVCGDLRLSLQLDSRGREERTVIVSAPSNEVKAMLALVRVHFEVHPTADAITAVRVLAVSEKLRPAQLDLFQPSGPAPAQLAATLARLAAICGGDKVGAPVVLDEHRRDAFAVEPFRGEAGKPVRAAPPPRPQGLLLSLRAFRPPQSVEVSCQRDRPEFVRGSGISGRVVQAAGPWRLYGSWWNERRYARDYYDAQLSDGAVYRLYCDLYSSQWFVEGMYD